MLSHCVHSITDTSLSLEGNRNMFLKYGHLPPNTTTDPLGFEPVESRSWILDLDMHSSEVSKFSVDRISSQAEEYASVIYSVFRWAVTDDFLMHFGGNVHE
ncbi:MAG: TIGR04255 family protein [Sphingobacteriaceae bacterium]|nr:MAG: TIGR04255 family protein [Sphingobacteriaceae bacterium]